MKRRSNSKEVKEKIQSHILECIDVEAPCNNDRDELEAVVKGFKKWWGDHKELRNHHQAFSEYLKCLPSQLTVEFEHYRIDERLQEWLGYDDKQYGLDEQYSRYLWLIYREFSALCRKHNVQFL